MRTSCWYRVAAAAVLAGAAGTAMAQAGSNTCAGAALITPGTYTGSTSGASSDGSAGCGSSTNAPDMWYRITPSQDATLNVETCGSGYDTVLSIHTGCPGTGVNQIACNDDACSLQSVVSAAVTAGQTYYIRVSGYSSSSGSYTLSVSYQGPPPPGSGPDVVYQRVNGIAPYGPVGGVAAYALGTDTCNIGNQNLAWTNGSTPGVGFNAYRLHDGRLMQIGQSWAKIACCAAVGNGCGLSCNGQGGNVLGAGCLDVYGASYNGSHGGLRPRSRINAWTGQFTGQISGPTGTVDRRLQVQTSDMSPANFPGALYFVEGVYVASDEAPEARMNNASYHRVNVSGTSLSLTGATQATIPAIFAWREHGLGVGVPDPSVTIQEADVPEEGRFFVAHKVRDNGNGTWRYEYAVFNLNSDRSGGSFSVPVASGAAVTNIGFNGVPYHSGEPYDNTPWTASVSGGEVRWASPQTHLQNPNSNALRWGTMYNFWFDADRPPAEADATLGLFNPGTPGAITISVGTPTGGDDVCPADWNGDELVNSGDITAFLGDWLASIQDGTLVGDFNGDGAVNSADITAFLGAWLDAVQQGGC